MLRPVDMNSSVAATAATPDSSGASSAKEVCGALLTQLTDAVHDRPRSSIPYATDRIGNAAVGILLSSASTRSRKQARLCECTISKSPPLPVACLDGLESVHLHPISVHVFWIASLPNSRCHLRPCCTQDPDTVRQQLAALAPDREAFLSREASLRADGCAPPHCRLDTVST